MRRQCRDAVERCLACEADGEQGVIVCPLRPVVYALYPVD